MAIPSLAEAKAKVTSEEIAVYESDITKHLESAVTIEFLEDEQQLNRTVIRVFPGKTISAPALAALKASIEAAGWTDVKVENGTEPPRQGIGSSGAPSRPQVTVSFKPAASGPAPDPEDDETGG